MGSLSVLADPIIRTEQLAKRFGTVEALKGVDLEVEAGTVFEATDLVAMADADMLRRAVLNLLLNALDALPAGGELVLTACQTRAGLEIEVADSG